MVGSVANDGATNIGAADSMDGTLIRLKAQQKKEEAAKSERSKASIAQIEAAEGGYSKPAPEFKPTAETASGLMGLMSLVAAAGGILGGKGRTSGLMAINAASGMMEGYNKGRSELYEQQRQMFDEHMKSWEQNRKLVKEAFDRALRIAPTNLTLAQETLNRDLIALDLKPLAAINKTSGPMAAHATFRQVDSTLEEELKKYRQKLGPKATTSDLITEYEATKADERAKAAAEKAALDKRKKLAQTQLEEQKLSGGGLTAEQQLKEDQDRKLAEALAADPSKITTNQDRDLVIKYTGKVFDVVDKPKTVKEIAQQKVRNEAMINSTAESAGTLESIAKLPGPGTAGILANIGNREGILGYLSSTAARSKLESDQASLLNSWWTGLGSNLATLEKSGASTGLVGLADKFEKLKPLDGDSQIVVAGKLADARDLIINTMTAVKREKFLSPDEESALDQELSRVTKAIPFSRVDVTNALVKQLQKEGKDPKSIGSTLGELILGKAPSSTTSSPSTTPGASKTPYLRGREIEVRNGKWVFKDTGEDAK